MKYPRLKYALVSFAVVIVLNILFAFALTLINGPHPECAFNKEVGPCDLVGSSINSAGWNIVPATAIWLLSLFIGFFVIWLKQGSRNKVLNGLLLLAVGLPVLFMIVTLISIMKSVNSG